jgi:ergothioneine biosynthesis protein EgtB
MPDASPTKWHLAHTTWFFETFVLGATTGAAPFHPAFRVLFNSYYNAVGDSIRGRSAAAVAPVARRVLAYRAQSTQECSRCSTRRSTRGSALVELGIQHEQQHQELILTDLKHMLSCNPLQPAYQKTGRSRGPARASALDRIDGRPRASATTARLRVRQRSAAPHGVDRAFEIASHPVTHGDSSPSSRTAATAARAVAVGRLGCGRARGWQAPLYWERATALAHLHAARHGAGRANTPVCHVSFFEAEAYARWAGARCRPKRNGKSRRGARIEGNFLESGALHPLAWGEAPAEGKLAQVFGDVWEWTRSDYAPYPGFRTAPGAVGEYNGKFMCNQYVLRGGSCATPASHIRATYRNFFPADARWQFSGLRLARDAVSGGADLLRSTEHYRDLAPRYDHYTRRINRIRERAIAALRLQPGETVLDAGCGTGWCIPRLAARVGPQGSVIAFDPSPEMLGGRGASGYAGRRRRSCCWRRARRTSSCRRRSTRSSSATRTT